MGFLNNLITSTGDGERGPAGPQGISVSTITRVDNNDGSIDLTFNMTDGSINGPLNNSLVSDTLLDLNKVTITGTASVEKFHVEKADGSTLLTCDTLTNNEVLMENLRINTLTSNPNTLSIQEDGVLVFTINCQAGNKQIRIGNQMLPGATSLATNKRMVLYDSGTGQLFYNDTAEVLADGTQQIFNDVLDIGETAVIATSSFFVKAADATETFAVNTVTSVITQTPKIINTVTSSTQFQNFVGTAQNITGGLLNIFKKKA